MMETSDLPSSTCDDLLLIHIFTFMLYTYIFKITYSYYYFLYRCNHYINHINESLCMGQLPQ